VSRGDTFRHGDLIDAAGSGLVVTASTAGA
jgi:hypothetical protein